MNVSVCQKMSSCAIMIKSSPEGKLNSNIQLACWTLTMDDCLIYLTYPFSSLLLGCCLCPSSSLLSPSWVIHAGLGYFTYIHIPSVPLYSSVVVVFHSIFYATIPLHLPLGSSLILSMFFLFSANMAVIRIFYNNRSFSGSEVLLSW